MRDVFHYLFMFLMFLFMATMGLRFDVLPFIIFPLMCAGYVFVMFIDALIREW
jgi:hypothetical protein